MIEYDLKNININIYRYALEYNLIFNHVKYTNEGAQLVKLLEDCRKRMLANLTPDRNSTPRSRPVKN